MKLPYMEVAKFFAGTRDVQQVLMNIITYAPMQVHTANDPVPRRIGLTTDHTNIAANKVLRHIRKVARSHYTKRKSTSKTLHRTATQCSYAPDGI